MSVEIENDIELVIETNSTNDFATPDQVKEILRQLEALKVDAAIKNKPADVNWVEREIQRINNRQLKGLPLRLKMVASLSNKYVRRKKSLRYWETTLHYDNGDKEVVYIRSANENEYNALPAEIKLPSFEINFGIPIYRQQALAYIQGKEPFPKI